MKTVPEIRIHKANEIPPDPQGDYVVYWMIANRRLTWNYSLERAVDWAVTFDRPLVILEALRVGYPWASDRFHRFIMEGMACNKARAEKYPVLYYPYLEPSPNEGRGLLQALSRKACIVVTDDFPAFFLPRMVASAALKIGVALETIDSNGLLPMAATNRIFPTAYIFRRFLQKELPRHLQETPRPDPLRGAKLKVLKALPSNITGQWPMASDRMTAARSEVLSAFPIDHTVAPAPIHGGSAQAQKLLDRFLRERLDDYPENRNHPDLEGPSGLSPYLHFGHVGAHLVLDRIAKTAQWTPDRVSSKATGGRSGWWGMGVAAEAFLDQLVTWREIGFNMCRLSEDYDRFESLPDWALTTLKRHEKDRRRYLYSLVELERARTHDPLWNAAQTQLLREGRIHNYLRMLWGKKILEWTPTPRAALDVLIELNNKYALDGRDPNSYSGIFWILGRYDRAWGPERPFFGKVRYMSSENTARKLRVSDYIRKYSPLR
ncbi:MAG: deoxyribodipyrimidine photolyase [Desulfatiglandales bacterium]